MLSSCQDAESVPGRSALGPSRPLRRIPVMVSFLTQSGRPTPRADDFAMIRARMEEVRRERAQALGERGDVCPGPQPQQ